MKKYITIIAIALILIWMLVIYYFSSQSNSEITLSTSSIVRFVVELFEGDKFNSYSMLQQKQIINKYYLYLSKIAHFLEYGILCYFCFIALQSLKNKWIRYIICLIICILYAIGDEFHQSFSVGRAPTVEDVIIDFFGAVVMILFIELISRIKHIIRIGKKND